MANQTALAPTTAPAVPRPFRWRKQGHLFQPNGRFDWMDAYAQVPFVLPMEDRLRVFFTCRPPREPDGSIVSTTSFVDLDREDVSKVLYVHDRPVIGRGGPGTFDEFGVMPGSVVSVPECGELWMYYAGWTRMASVPYAWANGLAVSRDGGLTFERAGRGPILAATQEEPYLQGCPRVTRHAPDRWEMWYLSGLGWHEHEGRMESEYVLMRATSTDGVHWVRDARAPIPRVVPDECQTAASVIELDGVKHMFFCHRHSTRFRNGERGYRIGYAWSVDGDTWHRDDEAGGLAPSQVGWDSEMVGYPHLTTIGGKVHMFYCGNYFGRDGFGCAVLER